MTAIHTLNLNQFPILSILSIPFNIWISGFVKRIQHKGKRSLVHILLDSHSIYFVLSPWPLCVLPLPSPLLISPLCSRDNNHSYRSMNKILFVREERDRGEYTWNMTQVAVPLKSSQGLVVLSAVFWAGIPSGSVSTPPLCLKEGNSEYTAFTLGSDPARTFCPPKILFVFTF